MFQSKTTLHSYQFVMFAKFCDTGTIQIRIYEEYAIISSALGAECVRDDTPGKYSSELGAIAIVFAKLRGR